METTAWRDEGLETHFFRSSSLRFFHLSWTVSLISCRLAAGFSLRTTARASFSNRAAGDGGALMARLLIRSYAVRAARFSVMALSIFLPGLPWPSLASEWSPLEGWWILTGCSGSFVTGSVKAAPLLQSSAENWSLLTTLSSSLSGDLLAESVSAVWAQLWSSQREKLDSRPAGIWLTIQSSATEDEELLFEVGRSRDASLMTIGASLMLLPLWLERTSILFIQCSSSCCGGAGEGDVAWTGCGSSVGRYPYRETSNASIAVSTAS